MGLSSTGLDKWVDCKVVYMAAFVLPSKDVRQPLEFGHWLQLVDTWRCAVEFHCFRTILNTLPNQLLPIWNGSVKTINIIVTTDPFVRIFATHRLTIHTVRYLNIYPKSDVIQYGIWTLARKVTSYSTVSEHLPEKWRHFVFPKRFLCFRVRVKVSG